jgi:hypothetical protein
VIQSSCDTKSIWYKGHVIQRSWEIKIMWYKGRVIQRSCDILSSILCPSLSTSFISCFPPSLNLLKDSYIEFSWYGPLQSLCFSCGSTNIVLIQYGYLTIGNYITKLFSETTNLIEPKLYMNNQWMLLYKVNI